MNRLLFEKKGDAVYISHLDLMRIFQRAFQRADIMIWHSQGFSPRAYVSIALPLSVGMSSQCEILDFEIEDGSVELSLVPEKLNATLPEGIRVLCAYNSDRKIRHLAYLAADVSLEYDGGVPEGAEKAVAALFARPSLCVRKRTKRGEADLDLIPLIRSPELERSGENELILHAVVTALNPTLNPQLLVSAIEAELPAFAPDFSTVFRREVYDGEMKVFR